MVTDVLSRPYCEGPGYVRDVPTDARGALEYLRRPRAWYHWVPFLDARSESAVERGADDDVEVLDDPAQPANARIMIDIAVEEKVVLPAAGTRPTARRCHRLPRDERAVASRTPATGTSRKGSIRARKARAVRSLAASSGRDGGHGVRRDGTGAGPPDGRTAGRRAANGERYIALAAAVVTVAALVRGQSTRAGPAEPTPAQEDRGDHRQNHRLGYAENHREAPDIKASDVAFPCAFLWAELGADHDAHRLGPTALGGASVGRRSAITACPGQRPDQGRCPARRPAGR